MITIDKRDRHGHSDLEIGPLNLTRRAARTRDLGLLSCDKTWVLLMVEALSMCPVCWEAGQALPLIDNVTPPDRGCLLSMTPLRQHSMAHHPIHDATAKWDADKVRQLLKEDAGLVHARSEDGSTPLVIASYEDDLEMARLLLDSGADANITYSFPEDGQRVTGCTPLILACAKGHAQLIILLEGPR